MRVPFQICRVADMTQIDEESAPPCRRLTWGAPAAMAKRPAEQADGAKRPADEGPVVRRERGAWPWPSSRRLDFEVY